MQKTVSKKRRKVGKSYRRTKKLPRLRRILRIRFRSREHR
jgi:hypothetical protein